MKLWPTEFKVGDVVEATRDIWRMDRRSELKPGEWATVRSVFRAGRESPQIIDLDVGERKPICDIVCFEDVPLRLVKPFQ